MSGASITSYPLALALLLSACDKDPGAPDDVITTLDVVAGSDQQGTVGQLLSQPIRIQVRDPDGAPQSNVAVSIVVAPGNGSVNGGDTFTSDQSGLIEISWRLGTAAGTQEIRAFTETDTTVITAEALAGPLASVVVMPAAATLLRASDTVRIAATGLDQFGNPIPNVSVTWHTQDSAIARVSNTGLVTAIAHGVVGISARTSNGLADSTQVTVPILGMERVLAIPINGDNYQLVGNFLFSRGSFTATLHRLDTGAELWRVSGWGGDLALGDRYAAISDTGVVRIYDLQTGIATQLSDSAFKAYHAMTSGAWIAYEVRTGSGPNIEHQGIRIRNPATGETRYVTTTATATSTQRGCGGRPQFDYPYLAFADSGWIKVYDVQRDTVFRVVNAGPVQSLSLSGTRVAWLVGDVSPRHVQVRDFTTNESRSISIDPFNGEARCAMIDGNIVAWSADPGGTLGRPTSDVFMHDIGTGITNRISNTNSYYEPSITVDARRLIYVTGSSGQQRFHLLEPL